jgi:hypothetical protein
MPQSSHEAPALTGAAGLDAGDLAAAQAGTSAANRRQVYEALQHLDYYQAQ